MELPDSCPAVLLNPSLCHLFQGALHILSLSITLANGKVHLKFCPNLFSFSRLPLKRLNFFVATDKGFPTPPGNTGPQFKVQKIPKYNWQSLEKYIRIMKIQKYNPTHLSLLPFAFDFFLKMWRCSSKVKLLSFKILSDKSLTQLLPA